MNDQYIQIETSDSGIAVIILDNTDAKLNVLSTPFMNALEKAIDSVAAQNPKAVVIRSGKSKGFVAGANIEEIEHIETSKEGYEKSRKGQIIYQKIANLPMPTIAAVNGHCMGGGTEMILACDYRLAAQDRAKIALPEVNLGIFPGWGGTQRLPRLISLQTALDIILTGRSYNAYRAYKAGLVDKMVPDAILNDYAIEFAEEIVEKGGRKYLEARKKKAGGLTNSLLEKNPLGRNVIWSQARKNVMQKTGGNYPAPLKAIEVVKKGLSTSLEQGLIIESEKFGELITTPEHKNLLHVYHLSERPKKQTGVEGDVKPAAVKNTAVLGAGVMGGGIAQLLAYNDYPVRMKDIAQEAVVQGLEHARSIFDKAVKRHKLSKIERDRKVENISSTLDYKGFGRVDFVIEAVIERMPVKQSVLKEVEEFLPEDSIFASNTSALSITELQSVAKHPERVGGMHFFNPVHKMPLVEVIRGEKTDDRTVATIFDFAKKLGKTPIVVKDSPGFLVNRLLGVYLNEACLLAEEGYDFEWMDKVVRKFGMPMGPFRLIDEVGIDIAADVSETLSAAFGSYLQESSLLKKVHDFGLFGKKKNRGFYIYEKGHSKSTNDDIRQFVSGTKKPNEEEVVRRMMYLMVNEAARCLEEEVVRTPHDIDIGMIFGTGFPPFHGGLCKYADTRGFSAITENLTQFAAAYGSRFEPVEYLRANKGFYEK